MPWSPSDRTRSIIERFYSDLVAAMPEQVGIDEILPGCEVISLDTFGVGTTTLPRDITVKVHNRYRFPVRYYGIPPGLQIGDEVLVAKMRSGNLYTVIGASGATAVNIAPADAEYVVMSLNDDLQNERVLAAGEWIALADGGAGGNATLSFAPSVPVVYDPVSGLITEHVSIAAAISAASSGDSVIVPPGVYDESFTLKNDVPVVELFSGAVTIEYDGSALFTVRATGPGDYYIDVANINIDAFNNTSRVSAILMDGTGTLTVLADVRAVNSHPSFGTSTAGIVCDYFGKIIYRAKSTGIYVRDGSTFVFGGSAYGALAAHSDAEIDGIGNIEVQTPTGSTGNGLFVDDEDALYSTGAIIKWRGDINCVSKYATFGIYGKEGLVEYNGDINIVSTTGSSGTGIQIFRGGGVCTIIADGDITVSSEEAAEGVICFHESGDVHTIKYTGRIVCNSNGGIAYGVRAVQNSAGATVDVQLLHVDIECTGDVAAYGVYAEDSSTNIVYKSGSVTTSGPIAFDIFQNDSARLELLSVDYFTRSGEIALGTGAWCERGEGLIAASSQHHFGGGATIYDFMATHPGSETYIGSLQWIAPGITFQDWQATSYGGPYCEFDGTNSVLYITDAAWQEVSDAALGTDETLLVWHWVNTNDNAATQVIASKSEVIFNFVSWLISGVGGGNWQFRTNQTGAPASNVNLSSSKPFVTGWHFVAGYWQASTLMRIFVAQPTDTYLTIDSLVVGVPASCFDGGAPLAIGSEFSVGVVLLSQWDGKIGRGKLEFGVPVANINAYAQRLFEQTRWYYR